MTAATHPTHDCLLAAILDRPDDDLARLVYADWLEEYGDEGERARAEFIRDQVLVVPGSLDWDILDAYLEQWCPWFERHDERGFKRRAGDAPPLEVFHLGGEKTVWRRGFIEEVHCPLAAWVGGECARCRPCWAAGHRDDNPRCMLCHGTGKTPAAGPDLATRHPVREVRITDRELPVHGYGQDLVLLRRISATLPAWLWDTLDGYLCLRDGPLGPSKAYRNEGDVRRALSDALILWARLPRKETP